MHAFGLRCAGRRFVGADSCSCAENKALTLHEDPKLGVFVKGAVEQIVGSLADVLRLVQKGEQKRKTGSDRACVPIAALTFPRTASRLLTATAGRSTEQMKNSHAILSLILEFRNVRAKRRGLHCVALRAALCLHPTTGCMSSTRTPCAGWLGQVVSKSARAPMPTTEGTGGRRDRSKRSGSFNGDSGRAVRVSKLMVIDLGTSEPVWALRPTLPCPCGWSGGRTCWLCRSRASRARSRWYSSRKSYTNYRASS